MKPIFALVSSNHEHVGVPSGAKHELAFKDRVVISTPADSDSVLVVLPADGHLNDVQKIAGKYRCTATVIEPSLGQLSL